MCADLVEGGTRDSPLPQTGCALCPTFLLLQPPHVDGAIIRAPPIPRPTLTPSPCWARHPHHPTLSPTPCWARHLLVSSAAVCTSQSSLQLGPLFHGMILDQGFIVVCHRRLVLSIPQRGHLYVIPSPRRSSMS